MCFFYHLLRMFFQAQTPVSHLIEKSSQRVDDIVVIGMSNTSEEQYSIS